MTAAGHAEITVVCKAEKPKPCTIWLENWRDYELYMDNSLEKDTYLTRKC